MAVRSKGIALIVMLLSVYKIGQATNLWSNLGGLVEPKGIGGSFSCARKSFTARSYACVKISR